MESRPVTFINSEIVLKVKNAYDPSLKVLKWEVDKESAATKRHILSETFRLLVDCHSDSGVYVKSFFVKSPCQQDSYTKNLVGPVTEKEYEMYKNILPAFGKISDLNLPVIRSYYLHEDGSIIMDDLAQMQYRWYNTSKPLDTNHVIHFLRALAQFHACSVKLDETSPEVLDKVRKYELLEIILEDESKSVLLGNRFLKLLTRVDPVFVEQNKNQLLRAKENFFKMAISEGAYQEEGFNVLNHGDVWITNMMFRYDKDGEIDDIKFFDYQFSHWANPANDLLRFFTMSVDFETFEEHYQHFLDEYLHTLLDSLKYLGCKKSYTTEKLLEDIENKTLFWTLLLIWLGPVFFSREEEFHGDVFDENLIEGENFQQLLKKWMPFFIKRIMRTPNCKLFTG